MLVLEASIEDIQKSGLDANRDIRRQEKSLKSLVRRQDEQQVQISLESRKIESLERQVVRATEQVEKLTSEKAELENSNYAKQRLIGALSAQLEAALYVAEKLNKEVTPEARFLLRSIDDVEEAAVTEAKAPQATTQAKAPQPTTQANASQQTTAKAPQPTTQANASQQTTAKATQPATQANTAQPTPQVNTVQQTTAKAPQPSTQANPAKPTPQANAPTAVKVEQPQKPLFDTSVDSV